jgi:hypothetical protein
MKDLTRLYDRLTPKERFVALEAAISRMDEQEIKALETSCPKKPYLLPDLEYSDLKTGFFNAWLHMQHRSSQLIKAMALAALVISYENGEKTQVKNAGLLLGAHKALEIAWVRFVEYVGLGKYVGEMALNSTSDLADGFIIDTIWLLCKDRDLEPSEEAIAREYQELISCWQD